MMKKLLLSLLLLAVAGVLFATFQPEKQELASPLAVSEELAAEARSVVRELLRCARTNRQKEFAALCVDARAKHLAENYWDLRRLKIEEHSPWRVYTLNGRNCRVTLPASDGEAYDCVLQFDPKEETLKFQALEAY